MNWRRILKRIVIYSVVSLTIKLFWKESIVAILPGLAKDGWITTDVSFHALFLTIGLLVLIFDTLRFDYSESWFEPEDKDKK